MEEITKNPFRSHGIRPKEGMPYISHRGLFEIKEGKESKFEFKKGIPYYKYPFGSFINPAYVALWGIKSIEEENEQFYMT